MELEIGTCTAEEWPALLACLDEEFVFKKKRSLSLARRFLHTFDVANLHQIYVARVRGSICSATAVRLFHWYTENRMWHGAMIGGVYTEPDQRSRGFASLVLRNIQAELVKCGVDFGVLWTTTPEFYEQLGWRPEDIGMFGEFASCMPSADDPVISPHEIADCDVHGLNALYSRFATEYVVRSEQDYYAVPLPANSVQAFVIDEAGEVKGYALVGKVGETGYVYELVGSPTTSERLWPAVVNSYGKVYVNDRLGSPSHAWLTAKGGVVWKPQHLAMWLPLSQEAKRSAIGGWYIPFLDRI